MLIVVEIEVVDERRLFPIEADSRVVAVDKVRVFISNRWPLMSVTTLHTIETDTADVLIEAVDTWYGNYADFADGNDDIDDREFDEVTDFAVSAVSAILKVQE